MLVAADNITASRPSVRKALEQEDAQFLDGLCRRLAKAGAAWLDLNPGHVPAPRREALWRFLVRTAEDACDLPLILDAPRAADLAQALKHCTRPPVLNMATAQPQRLEAFLELAKAHDLDLIAATMEDQVPPAAGDKLALAAFIAASAQKMGLDPRRLILDPMVMPLAMPGGEAHAAGVLGFLRALPQVLDPPPRTIIALSNLVTGTARARAGFAAGPFLAAAAGAGLDMVLMDALDRDLMQMVGLCRSFQGQGIFAPGEYGDRPSSAEPALCPAKRDS